MAPAENGQPVLGEVGNLKASEQHSELSEEARAARSPWSHGSLSCHRTAALGLSGARVFFEVSDGGDVIVHILSLNNRDHKTAAKQ